MDRRDPVACAAGLAFEQLVGAWLAYTHPEKIIIYQPRLFFPARLNVPTPPGVERSPRLEERIKEIPNGRKFATADYIFRDEIYEAKLVSNQTDVENSIIPQWASSRCGNDWIEYGHLSKRPDRKIKLIAAHENKEITETLQDASSLLYGRIDYYILDGHEPRVFTLIKNEIFELLSKGGKAELENYEKALHNVWVPEKNTPRIDIISKLEKIYRHIIRRKMLSDLEMLRICDSAYEVPRAIYCVPTSKGTRFRKNGYPDYTFQDPHRIDEYLDFVNACERVMKNGAATANF